MGFRFWELIIDDELPPGEVDRVKDAVETLGLATSVHAPFSDLNIASLNPGIREISIEKVEKAVEAAAVLGAGPVTLHAGRSSPVGLFHPEKVRQTNIESLKRLVEFAGERGVELCVENSPRFPGVLASSIQEIEETLDAVPGLGLTLDIGHANTCGALRDFLRDLSGRIGHMHVHDNDGKEDRHLHLGAGAVDLRALGRFLKGFQKTVVIETHRVEDIEPSRETLEGLI